MPLVAATLVVIAALTMVLARLAGATVDAAQAQSAADAAALAAVDGGMDAARRLADANGAVLVSCVCDTDPVEVTVTVGEATAVARASRVP